MLLNSNKQSIQAAKRIIINQMQLHELQSRIIFQNDDIIVLDKPAGIPVHAGRGGGINLQQFFGLLRFEKTINPQLAHRLDKDTSGCLLLGRTKEIMPKLGKMFTHGRIDKTYMAVLDGTPQFNAGIISQPIGKKTDDPHEWQMRVRDDGQAAITHYKVIKTANGKTLIELKPKTGRTHQLRVHMAHLGCPIIGDKIYGNGVEGSRLMLHAYDLKIPLHNNEVTVTAQLPEIFKL